MVHSVEERLQVAVNRMTEPQLPAGLHSAHCRMGIAALAEAVTLVAELAVIERGEHLGDGLLDHSIQHRRNSEGPLRPIGFGDVNTAHGRWVIRPCFELGGDALPVLAGKRRELVDGHPIHPRRSAIAPDSLPGALHVRGVEHLPEPRLCLC